MKEEMVKLCFQHMRNVKKIREEIKKLHDEWTSLMEGERIEFGLARSLVAYLENVDDGTISTDLWSEFNRLADEEIPL